MGCFLLLLSFGSLSQTNVTQPHLAKAFFFVVAEPGTVFWESQIDFAQAVSGAMNMELQVVYVPHAHNNRFGFADFVEKTLNRSKSKPDLVISPIVLGAGKVLLDVLHKLAVPLISINSHLSPIQLEQFGTPRQKFPLWLAQMAPDDIQAGKLLALSLGELTQQRKLCELKPCAMNMFAFSGERFSTASQRREVGLRQGVKQASNISLYNLVHANWQRNTVTDMMKLLLNRHKDIDIFWVASDEMAYGVVDGLQNAGKLKDTVIGSIDWAPQTVDYIRKNQIQISVGGHFTEAGWALILFADYLRVGDFAQQFGTVFQTSMSVLDQTNVKTLGAFLQSPQWSKAIIRGYSRFYNPTSDHYRFDTEELIQQHLQVIDLQQDEQL